MQAWERQSVWSQTAGDFKKTLYRLRAATLVLLVGGAVLSAAYVSGLFDGAVGRAAAFSGGFSLALAGVISAAISPSSINAWTRARSVSEGIKSEIYLYLARSVPYDTDERDHLLEEKVAELEDDFAVDLRDKTLRFAPQERPIPAVFDIPSYLAIRVAEQIENYYRPQAAVLSLKLARLRRVELVLAVAGAALASAAGVWETGGLAVWVPVATTISGAVTAHAAAERLDFLVIEYLRTASQLERIARRRNDPSKHEDLVSECENVISNQNSGWMARLSGD